VRPPIITRVKPPYIKRKPNDPPRKPGKPSWIWGTKAKFFEARKEVWVTVAEKKMPGEKKAAAAGTAVGDFYSKMAKLYLVKYGYDLADKQDFEFDVEDPPDWVANHVSNDKLPAEESKKRQQEYEKVKEVSPMGFVESLHRFFHEATRRLVSIAIQQLAEGRQVGI
jgi:hypothetical protein